MSVAATVRGPVRGTRAVHRHRSSSARSPELPRALRSSSASTPAMDLRCLHWVIRTGDRTALWQFLHEDLEMHVLRHEEFSEGCEAFCNGPYHGKWSKSMVGYGPEDSNFVIEVTYNYGIKHYEVGNDLAWLKIRSRPAHEALTAAGKGSEVDVREIEVQSPENSLTFRVVGEDPDPGVGALCGLCLNVTDVQRAEQFWAGLLGLLEVERGEDFVALACGEASATVRLAQLPPGQGLQRGTGYGRLAFSCPAAQLLPAQEAAEAKGYAVLTPLVTLETPGKAAVQVVILADPDGHEVCLVGDEAFRQLSQVDDAAMQLLGEAIAKDDSADWFAKIEARKVASKAGAATK